MGKEREIANGCEKEAASERGKASQQRAGWAVYDNGWQLVGQEREREAIVTVTIGYSSSNQVLI